MRFVIMATAVSLVFTPFCGSAEEQMLSQNLPGMSTTRQVMSPEHARDLTRLMSRLEVMLREISRIIDEQEIRRQAYRQDLAQLIQGVSETLHAMAQYAWEGRLTQPNREQIELRVDKLSDEMQGLKERAGLSGNNELFD